MMRAARALIGLLAILLIVSPMAGCQGFGESGLASELARVKSINGFAVLSKSAQKVDIAAQGRRVRLAPATGLCIAEDSLTAVKDGAFAMIAECSDAAGGGVVSFPGVVTVSISGEKGFGGTGRGTGDLAEIRAFLETQAGRALLGRGGDPAKVKVIEMRQLGDALYLYVEDPEGDQLGVFSPRFWRAFVRVNKRLLLATVNGFAARPVPRAQMLSLLALQVTKLREANLAPLYADEQEVARGAIGQVAEASEDPTPRAPGTSPRPASRLRTGTALVEVPEEELLATADLEALLKDTPDPQVETVDTLTLEAALEPAPSDSQWAPDAAPAAPRRPG